MKVETGAFSFKREPQIRHKTEICVFARKENGKIRISHLNKTTHEITGAILNIVDSMPEYKGKHISFLWTNGTKNLAQEINYIIGQSRDKNNVTVLENTQDGETMERDVIQKLRDYDSQHGLKLNNIPDENLWGETFKPLMNIPKLDENERRMYKLSDIMDKHESEKLKDEYFRVKNETELLIPPDCREIYELRSELVRLQRSVSKNYASNISEDVIILIRKKKMKAGIANMAELRTIYRDRHASDCNNIIKRRFVDIEIAI